MFKKYLACASLGSLLFLGSVPVSFADNNDAHSAFTGKTSKDNMAPANVDNSASAEYKQTMEKMNKGMMKGMVSDASTSWAKMMVEHHQGAIDMSKTVLKNTKDPEIKQMAEKSIKEQSESISELKAWLSKK